MPFLTPNQQRQSSEGQALLIKLLLLSACTAMQPIAIDIPLSDSVSVGHVHELCKMAESIHTPFAAWT